ncbi:MAG: ABC transporter permease [Oscillospiraceae bacterium]|jgi:putative ABC transport system permease protein|nr:ABC transporter permease [Oscillospiraceae bacterium]
MNGIHKLNLLQFGLIYLLLIVVLAIMKKRGINQSKLLIVASVRMTVQLVLAGLALTYIFQNPHPAFTVMYLVLMTGFAIYTALSRNRGINRNFKITVAVSLAASGLAMVAFFILAVVGVNFFNAQYTIPISGMIMGNAMTGVSLGLKTFNQSICESRAKIETLTGIGAKPKRILSPIVNSALETALLPTMNSMLGMGVISLPGMMTGQILSGTLPTTAILYQIAIIIAICAVTCLSVFCSLYFGAQTLYNKRGQFFI